jgi:hypothetical protein
MFEPDLVISLESTIPLPFIPFRLVRRKTDLMCQTLAYVKHVEQQARFPAYPRDCHPLHLPGAFFSIPVVPSVD